MVEPETVISPKDKWTLIKVLAKTEEWALALGHWKEDGTSRGYLAMRKNGHWDPDSKGSPVSHGQATWFLVPSDFVPQLMSFVPAGDRPLVKGVLGL